MKKIRIITLLITGFVSCKKEEILQTVQDKEIRISFPTVAGGTFNTSFETLPVAGDLNDFDKRDYPGVDSITFIVGLLSGNISDTAYIRLYDLTDDVVIDSTLLKASTPLFTTVVVQTNNIFNMLPDKKIDIAIQMRTSNETNYAEMGLPYFKLRRP